MKAPWSTGKRPNLVPIEQKTLFFTIILQLSESLEKAQSRELSYVSTGSGTTTNNATSATSIPTTTTNIHTSTSIPPTTTTIPTPTTVIPGMLVDWQTIFRRPTCF